MKYIIALALTAPLISATPSSLPKRQTACSQSYRSKAGDTCYKLDQQFGLLSGTIFKANDFLGCDNIWAQTPICVPAGPRLADLCKVQYKSVVGDTCASLETRYGLITGTIKSHNDYIDCTKPIWVNSPVCIADGPYKSTDPRCSLTYISKAGDTCASLETQYSLAEGAIQAYNGALTCSNIRAKVAICVPNASKKTDCQKIYIAQTDDTCPGLDTKFNYAPNTIKNANPALSCGDIWYHTPICIPLTPTTREPCPGESYTTSKTDKLCTALDQKYDIVDGSLEKINPGIDCANLLFGTKLCVATEPPRCKEKYTPKGTATCAQLELWHNIEAGTIKKVTPQLDCTKPLPTTAAVCIPDGPYVKLGANCVTPHITSAAGTTCSSLDTQFELVDGTVKKANPNLTCDNLPAKVPICIPAGHKWNDCKEIITPKHGDTCQKIQWEQNLATNVIRNANPTVDCDDVLTPAIKVCIPDGPYRKLDAACVTPYSTATADETCAGINDKLNFAEGTIEKVNANLNCAKLPLKIPVCLPAGPKCWRKVSAVAGQSCNAIGYKLNIQNGAIAEVNQSKNCDSLPAGASVCIPFNKFNPCAEVPEKTYARTWMFQTNCISITANMGINNGALFRVNPWLDCNNVDPGVPFCMPTAPRGDNCVLYRSTGQSCQSIVEGQGMGSIDVFKFHNPEIDCGREVPETRGICVPKVPWV